jgi:uncharacterized protein (TIGR00730 family)
MSTSLRARAIGVFCGAHAGSNPGFAHTATAAGELIARAGFSLVYGGASGGLMGHVAEGALSAGGEIVGVLPPVRNYEQRHPRLTHAIETSSLSERKAIMLEMSSAFVVLPGGLGTLDELFEVVVLNETFKTMAKPVFILNVAGYFDLLLAWRSHAEASGFVKAAGLAPRVMADLTALSGALSALQAPAPPTPGVREPRMGT